MKHELISEILLAHIRVIESLKAINEVVVRIVDSLYGAIYDGRRVFLCGNGGSAADAQHIAAELVGRFKKERRGLPAIALTTDTSIMTAVANDYGYEQVFARQIEALASAGDVLIGISTSGNSPNVVEAVKVARSIGVTTIGLTGGSGGTLKALCDETLIVPSDVTARIQEAHILVGHILCEMIDERLNADQDAAA
ncbi:D-sedoheptulose 7-phosphate isomerase [uncultured Chloroflexus sp.]|uniref:D-sedoheptulose 7-phosphate isomerase n=1 Tax=uncultured Chloroflexus sp. TaxID=214040 RepID=UPI0026111BCF|nr:D-sedoheptulose 7-phosphate isomerase [uncultured Chloroflexus sp.]